MERDSKGLAIVIKTESVRASDRLLWLLTPDRGIIKCYSFGSRKSIKSVKAPLYTEGNFSLYQKGENGQISLKDIDVIATHENVFSSIETIAVSSLISEIIIKSRDSDGYIYSLLVDALDGLEDHNPDLVASSFLLKYLKHSGMGADFKHCPCCGRVYAKDEILGFSSHDRVAVCSECDTMDKTLILPENARAFCARVLELKFSECLALGISDQQIQRIFRYLLRTLKLVFPANLKTLESGLLVQL